MPPKTRTLDANEAVALASYALNEVVAIYPITPSSPMGEWADMWASQGRPNLWGAVPRIEEMQSEAGVAGALHGALQVGSLATTYTASQGLLLMLPNMFKIAGELTPCVIHVAARTIATHALSIFGDHSDVMAARTTGFALLASNTVQEAHDLAVVSHAATLESRIPFLHFFDGFRTSHEINKIHLVDSDQMKAIVSPEAIAAFRARAMTPKNPVVRGTAQNPDTFFQSREGINPFYLACPAIVQGTMDRFAELTGRQYRLVDYEGAPDAERVVVVMGSGAETVAATAAALNESGDKTGVLKVRLYRPFPTESFLDALPPTVRSIAVLDRTKEPGATGEPLYQDVVTALAEAVATRSKPFDTMPRVIGGRYGLSSKEFNPAMARCVFDELGQDIPKNHFTVGIHDDVTHRSLDWDSAYSIEGKKTRRAVFFGLGSDGTVGANKNTIKIIGEETDLFAQGYFIYDSKKSGSLTVSHLRFGPEEIRAPYLIEKADFVACHQWQFIDRVALLDLADHGSTFLLNTPYKKEEVWDRLPRAVQEQIVHKQLRFHVVDALSVAREAGLGRRINTVMQTCFFALSGILERPLAIQKIKESIDKAYGRRGDVIVKRNQAAVDAALERLHEIRVPAEATSDLAMAEACLNGAPPFVKDVTVKLIEQRGDNLPVSAFPCDGTFPTGTTKYEKRDIAATIPDWDPSVCIQCGKCVMACPHGVIRAKLVPPGAVNQASDEFKTATSKWLDRKDLVYVLQIAPDDCTGCSLCVEACPAKNKSEAGRKAINMAPKEEIIERDRRNWEAFLGLPQTDRATLDHSRVKDVQLLEPLFEFSGACAGCGETPYIKLVTQLFGDRMVVANATGCSSIYGGNLPTTPWTTNSDGRGPTWNNSLFEDNAEFGLGMRLSLDTKRDFAQLLLRRLADALDERLVADVLQADQSGEQGIVAQRKRVAQLQADLELLDSHDAKTLLGVLDSLVRQSLWIVGGDGWAYDIGFGGLDHVLASGLDVNVLVLDTEVYSNTGGQQSKSTARGAVAKFAAGGKRTGKKDLAALAMTYGNVYVARVAMGGNDTQTIRALREADAWQGPSLVLAYSHCIAHGYDLSKGFSQQKAAVQSGYWPLLRYNPALAESGKNPLTLDSREPSIPLREFAYNEARYNMLAHSAPELAGELLSEAQSDIYRRWEYYRDLAAAPAEHFGEAPVTEASSRKGSE